MDRSQDKPLTQESREAGQAAAEDARQPYVAPRVVKRRAVAQATLFTSMGPSQTGLTMSG